MSPHKPFLIELEFSEPVQAPLDETFALTFDGTALPSGAFTVTELQPEASLRADPWQRQRRWLVDVRSPPVVLEGRVRLGVRAFDRNYHFTSPGSREYGTENDADPRTPARRMRVRAGLPRDPYLRDRDLWDDFTWHGPNSRDVNYPEADVPVGGFAYDRRPNGDESHYLLFDPTAPTGSATVSYPSLN